MRWLKGIALFLVAVIAFFGIGGMFLPASVHVERSIVVAQPPAAVFALVNSFARFNEWSPWADIDPNAKYSFEGPAEGVGAKMSWTGNDEVGTGSQLITASEPDRSVAIDLDFGQMGVAQSTYRLEPVAGGTRVTWGFDSTLSANPVERWFGLLMDDFIGADYEKGLAKLKQVVEAEPQS